jgi:CRP-like cAMP-binding protein
MFARGPEDPVDVRHRGPRNYRELLRSGRWFGGLPIDLQEQLLRAGTLHALGAEEQLFARGDANTGLYAVLDGEIRIGAISEGGEHSLLALLEPPSWFGEISVFDGQPRTHDAVAAKESLLLHVSQESLDEILAAEPAWWRELAHLLTSKLRLAFIVLEDIALLPLSVRLARRLALMAEGYGERAHQVRAVEVSQEQLAMMLATSRQSISPILKELEARRLIRLSYGTIEILDLAGLHAAAAKRD